MPSIAVKAARRLARSASVSVATLLRNLTPATAGTCGASVTVVVNVTPPPSAAGDTRAEGITCYVFSRHVPVISIDGERSFVKAAGGIHRLSLFRETRC